MSTAASDRIDVRISREQKDIIKYACELSGFKSLTEFVVFCINKEANKIIIENNQILKSIEDKKIFINAIMSPPKPNTRLKKAQTNYLKFLEANAATNKTTRKKSK
jgi:uncharacterized protein (DUF1778 family)